MALALNNQQRLYAVKQRNWAIELYKIIHSIIYIRKIENLVFIVNYLKPYDSL